MAGIFTLIKFKYSIQSRENHKWPKKRKNPRFNIRTYIHPRKTFLTALNGASGVFLRGNSVHFFVSCEVKPS